MTGYIKLHRSLKNWEWYSDINATRLLIHLLISVNYKDKKWKGIMIKKGSMVISWDSLSKDCGLSVMKCRTAMNKLEECGEVTRKTTNKFQLITLLKWDKLQNIDDDLTEFYQTNNNQITSDQQTNNKQITTTKESKEYKEGEESKELIKKFSKKDFKKVLVELGADISHVDDWMIVREKKKLAATETALKKFIKECEVNKFKISEAVRICAEKSWGGFNYQWILNSQSTNKQKPTFEPNR